MVKTKWGKWWVALAIYPLHTTYPQLQPQAWSWWKLCTILCLMATDHEEKRSLSWRQTKRRQFWQNAWIARSASSVCISVSLSILYWSLRAKSSRRRQDSWLNNTTRWGPEMVWGPHNMPLFSRPPVLLPAAAAWTVGWFETNWPSEVLNYNWPGQHSSHSSHPHQQKLSLHNWCQQWAPLLALTIIFAKLLQIIRPIWAKLAVEPEKYRCSKYTVSFAPTGALYIRYYFKLHCTEQNYGE